MSKLALTNYLGCFLGGAVGDALGAPTEFLSLNEIKRKYGYEGVSRYVEFEDNRGEITDDTQMTLFTAESLLVSKRGTNCTAEASIKSTFEAYQRWYDTQMMDIKTSEVSDAKEKNRCNLAGKIEMYKRRAPGLSCLLSLEKSRTEQCGTTENPINDSKGCGAVMRVSPIGLMNYDTPEKAFEHGVQAGALTHGHPDGYLPAGVLATIIAGINAGSNLMSAIEKSLIELRKHKRHNTTESAIVNAINLYKSHEATFENVEKLGGGWVGEEALSIALFCALHNQDNFEKGIILAINHSGDTDSTGSITGNILGLLLGEKAIPLHWITNLNMTDIISDMAVKLYNETR